MRFEIFSGTILIGRSNLELGDAPMGVAFGRFYPLHAYGSVQAQVVRAECGSLEELKLSVRTASGKLLEPVAGVGLRDFSADLGEEGLDVEVLGIGYPLYEELFPEHVAAYNQMFKRDA